MQNFTRKNPFILFIITIAITGCLYCFSASTRLTWANYANDSGDFLAAILTKGIPHPTGYPTYMLLGSLFQYLPIGTVYFRAILLSLVPVSISAGLMAVMFQKFFTSPQNKYTSFFAIFTGLAWGFSPFLWSQATIVEVHGLQSLFIVLALWWILNLLESPSTYNPKQRYLLAILFGVGLGNHVTLVLFLPAVIFASFAAHRKGASSKNLYFQILFLFLGTLVYAILPIRASQIPPINWGNASTWEGFWWLISGQAYQNLLLDISFLKILSRISAFAALLRQQFGIIGIILAVIGIVQYPFQSRFSRVLMTYIFLAYAGFSMIYGTDDSLAYLLSSFAVFSIWIGLSCSLIISWSWKNLPLGKAALILAGIIFLISIPKNFRTVDARAKTAPADFAETLLPQLPANAILATSADPDSFPLWYYHFGLGWRDDLTIFTLPLTQFRWYQQTLIHNYPNIKFPPPIESFRNGNQNWGESVYKLNPNLPYCMSKIQKGDSSKIDITCSGGESFQFVVDQNQ